MFLDPQLLLRAGDCGASGEASWDDPCVAGEARLAASNIGVERAAKKKRLEGKQQLKRQMELLMFEAAGDTELKDEMPGNEPCWIKHMQSMFPDYYQ